MALRQRLLRDIDELERRPYPNIRFIPYENDITQACLILTPNGTSSLHLTVTFPDNYPLGPPIVAIQTSIAHPNVIGSYICASILNTVEGWTAAYDLKGICIQLLSFFASDSIEQDYGNVKVDLDSYRASYAYSGQGYVCKFCSFDNRSTVSSRSSYSVSLADFLPRTSRLSADDFNEEVTIRMPPSHDQSISEVSKIIQKPGIGIADLPDELLVLVCDYLETEELAALSQAWNRVAGQQGIISRFNIIRNRELTCFCLKRDFDNAKLGVGVKVEFRGRIGSFESEFDLLSLQAFEEFKIRRSVQGLSFQHWLPLPISRRHYASVREHIADRLSTLSKAAHFPTSSNAEVIYGFMNDIVVRLSAQAESGYTRSSLVHASEKAIESYYHLFHLLLCLATVNQTLVRAANDTIKNFLVGGKTSKQDVPNLGFLLIACLISDADMTKDLLMAIVRETITRNVVWMLDKRGADMPELAYMEADSISTYRLQKTFDASKTSYRLLMFLNLFRRTINRGTGVGRKSLVQLREELFDAHGAPPRGTAARLANDIKALQKVQSFPEFLVVMGLGSPKASEFTHFLRWSVEESMRKGYSVWGVSQIQAQALRLKADPDVQIRAHPKPAWKRRENGIGFFPSSGKKTSGAARQGGGGQRGRGR